MEQEYGDLRWYTTTLFTGTASELRQSQMVPVLILKLDPFGRRRPDVLGVDLPMLASLVGDKSKSLRAMCCLPH